MRPDGLPIWVSDVRPGHLHDLTCARTAGALGALYWAASQFDLHTLADSGYDGAAQGIHTPIKQPGNGQTLAPDNQAYNTLLRSVRCLGERGFALLAGRWRALRRITASPSRIGDYAKAAFVLTPTVPTRRDRRHDRGHCPIPVPMAYYSFGGWKDSLFGQSHIHGPGGIAFYTRAEVVTARWPQPSGSSGAGDNFPTAT